MTTKLDLEYAQALSATLEEWGSPHDEEAHHDDSRVFGPVSKESIIGLVWGK